MPAECALCGGEVVDLARSSVPTPVTELQGLPELFSGYTPGPMCLGCGPLDAVPRGMVPESRPGADALARRAADARYAQEAAHAG